MPHICWSKMLGSFVAAAAAVFAGSLVPGKVNAQTTASANANAAANILPAAGLGSARDLSFGTFVRGTAGKITVHPVIGIVPATITGGITHFQDHFHAVLTVTGPAGQSYTVTVPSAPITLTNTATCPSPGCTMTADTFTINLPDAEGVIRPDGTHGFLIGSTLNVNAEQDLGDYAGPFDITLTFQ